MGDSKTNKLQIKSRPTPMKPRHTVSQASGGGGVKGREVKRETMRGNVFEATIQVLCVQ